MNDDDSSRTLIWQSVNGNRDRLTDHERRITILETRAHIPR